MKDEIKPAEKPKESAVSACQICGEPLDDTTVVCCRKCKTPHHRDCWRYNRGCAVFGCGCRTFEDAKALAIHGEPFSVSCPAVLGLMQRFSVVFGLMIFFMVFTRLELGLLFKPFIPIFFMLMAFTVAMVMHRARVRLTFYPGKNYIEHSRMIGKRVIYKQKEWLSIDDIVEVHVHSIEDPDHGIDKTLYLALKDGSRHLVQRMKNLGQTIADGDDIEETAERIAAVADTTVRFISGDEAPTVEEIKEAAAELELKESSKPALPEA